MKLPLDPRLPVPALTLDYVRRLNARLYELLRETIAEVNRKVTVLLNGTRVGTRNNINLIEGTGATITVVEDEGNDRINVTIDATGGGGGGCCKTYLHTPMSSEVYGSAESPVALAYTDFSLPEGEDQCTMYCWASLSIRIPPSTTTENAGALFYISISGPGYASDTRIGSIQSIRAPIYSGAVIAETEQQMIMDVSLLGICVLNYDPEDPGPWTVQVMGYPEDPDITSNVERLDFRMILLPCGVVYPPG